MNPFVLNSGSSVTPLSVLVGRSEEFDRLSEILRLDGDVVLTGVPGVGRRTLIRSVARKLGAKVVEIDCLRSTDCSRFLRLFADAMLNAFQSPMELSLVQKFIAVSPLELETSGTGRARLVWPFAPEWELFQILLALPQALAEALDCRVVLVFQNFPHIRSWDRSDRKSTRLNSSHVD